jgi:hypothetical protein
VNWKLGLACAVTTCCISCSGQTSNSSPSSIQFCLPALQLWAGYSPELHKSESPLLSGSILSAPIKIEPIEGTLNDAAFHSRVVRDDRFYLSQSKSVSHDGAVGFVQGIFTPEVFHLGKTSLTCPFATAMKRKNPLCLLSGISIGKTLTGDGQLEFRLLELSW